MGCDIHTYIEIYDEHKKEWIMAQGKFENEVPYADRFTDRNYILFGLLTNGAVRGRGYGFFDLKGLPNDCSRYVKERFRNRDYHSLSYLTFEEIEDKLKDIKIIISGMIEKQRLDKIEELLKGDYDEIKLAKLLYPYCQMTNDENYVDFQIEVPIEFEINSFMRYIERAKMYQWGHGSGLDKIRIVFGFDN